MRYPLKGSHEMRFTPYAVSMVSEDGAYWFYVHVCVGVGVGVDVLT